MIAKLYIRFSNDIDSDIERGYSFFKGGEKMDGLCAWTTNMDIINGKIINYNGQEVSNSEIIKLAESILNNTYASYSDNSEFHLITGTYVGSGNDGVLLKDIHVINSFSI